VVIGGQNGVDKSGRVVSDDIAGQTRQALHNLQACLRAADARAEHIVRWSLLIKDGASLQEGFGAFMEVWGEQPNPPAITAAMVSGLGVPGALIEIEALAAVPSSDA
jgi:enamine deaminase RidA (YjgF/YER057c/UK114 family)